MSSALPPGQRERRNFPRFGLPSFAFRLPADPAAIELELRGDVAQHLRLNAPLDGLPRSEQRSDFHCVTTWSRRGQHWSGVRFSEFYERVVAAAGPLAGVEWVSFHGSDGYRACLLLSDLLADDVLLADRLDGQPLGLDHGAPLRLVAPAHYGYKSVKHLVAMEFLRDRRAHRFAWPYPPLMEHPRARVALEERGRLLPPWLFRWLYRPLIEPTVWLFRIALRRRSNVR